jgi:AhpD family alkylhydroperoxidase
MARIDMPPGDELKSWLSLSPLGPGLTAFADAVYTKSRLSRREFEAARMRVALSNQCVTCLNTRYRDGEDHGLDADFYDHVLEWATHPGYSERERLAIEFAERFCERWQDQDDAFWSRLKACYSDGEIVDLALQVAELVGAGRILKMLDIAQTCGITIAEGYDMALDASRRPQDAPSPRPSSAASR